jgi:hypothetical protein
MRAALAAAATVLVLTGAAGAQQPGPSAALDFDFFRTRIQPIFMVRREGLARCYVCHSQGTPLVLQRLPQGRATWNEEESRKNFEVVQRVVTPGNPLTSRLLMMPLAEEAGGHDFHPGGKHWASQKDPEWRLLAEWVNGARLK